MQPAKQTWLARQIEKWKADGLWPTTKWWAATVTGVGGVTTAVVTDGLERPVVIAAIALVVQRAVAWITRNEPSNPAA